MREIGRPWKTGKAFDHSAPVDLLHPTKDVRGVEQSASIVLEVDGEVKQESALSHLIWSVPDIIANPSTLFELRPGDLIFTCTPEGVGKVAPGQLMTSRIVGLEPISVQAV